MERPHLSLEHCILQNNDYGFYGSDCSPQFLSNNQIINNSTDGIYLTGNSNPVFGNTYAEWNDIYENSGYNIRNNTSENIDAKYIYWGTSDSLEIAESIYDFYDDGSKGIVNFFPWTDSLHVPINIEDAYIVSSESLLDFEQVLMNDTGTIYLQLTNYGPGRSDHRQHVYSKCIDDRI